jgi:hypothetical protein
MTDLEHDEFVLRPSGQTYKRAVKSAPIPLIVLVVLLGARNGLVGLAIMAVTAAVTSLCAWRYLKTAQVIVTATEIGGVGF